MLESKRWCRDLNGLPAFTYDMLKHKKLEYQMFKDKYVGKVEQSKMLAKINFLLPG